MRNRVALRGIALVSIILVMLVLTLLAITFVATTTVQSRFSMSRQNSAVLRQTALIGINEMQKLLGSDEYKYKWHRADQWTKESGRRIARWVAENGSYYRIVVEPGECRPDWCTVTSEAYYQKDGSGEPVGPVKRITVTFKKNSFQYAAMGTSEGDLGVKIVGSTYEAKQVGTKSSRRYVALSYRSGNPPSSVPVLPAASYNPVPQTNTAPATVQPPAVVPVTQPSSSAPDGPYTPEEPITITTTHESKSVIDGDVGACRKSKVAVSLGITDSGSSGSGGSGQSSSSANSDSSSKEAAVSDFSFSRKFESGGT